MATFTLNDAAYAFNMTTSGGFAFAGDHADTHYQWLWGRPAWSGGTNFILIASGEMSSMQVWYNVLEEPITYPPPTPYNPLPFPIVKTISYNSGKLTVGLDLRLSSYAEYYSLDWLPRLNEGDDHFTGRDRRDIINGGTGNDTIYGHGGDDDLYGGPGDDILIGSYGWNRLFGGDGIDTAVFQGSRSTYTITRDGNAGPIKVNPQNIILLRPRPGCGVVPVRRRDRQRRHPLPAQTRAAEGF